MRREREEGSNHDGPTIVDTIVRRLDTLVYSRFVIIKFMKGVGGYRVRRIYAGRICSLARRVRRSCSYRDTTRPGMFGRFACA